MQSDSSPIRESLNSRELANFGLFLPHLQTLQVSSNSFISTISYNHI